MKTFNIVLDLDTRELLCASRALKHYAEQISSSGFGVDLYLKDSPQNRLLSCQPFKPFRQVILGIPDQKTCPEIYSGNCKIIDDSYNLLDIKANRRERYCKVFGVPIYEDFPNIYAGEDVSALTKAVELVINQRAIGYHKNTAQYLFFCFGLMSQMELYKKVSETIARRNAIMSFRNHHDPHDPWLVAWWMINSFIVITNECWMSHLAAALHVPTIVIDPLNEKQYHYASPHMHYLTAKQVFAEDVIQVIDRIL